MSEITRTHNGLPSIAGEEVRVKIDNLTQRLSQAPPQDQVRTNKMAQGAKYLEIGWLENQLDTIFQVWEFEVTDTSLIANSLTVTGHLRVLHPILGRFITRSGVGSVPIQVNKDASPVDFSEIKSKAIHMGLPSAKAYAFKNACQSLGPWFGRDLNRSDYDFTGLHNSKTLPQDVRNALMECSTLEELQEVTANCQEWALFPDFVRTLGAVKRRIKAGQINQSLTK